MSNQELPRRGYGVGVQQARQRELQARQHQKEMRMNQQKNKADNQLFDDSFVNTVGVAARFIGQVVAGAIMLAMIIFATTFDVAAGSLSFSLIFQYDFPWNSMVIDANFIAMTVSTVTSGIQILLHIMWGRTMTRWQKYIIVAIIIMDTLMDTVSMAWFTDHQTPLTFTISDKSFMFWVGAVLYGGVCMISESVIMWVAGMASPNAKFMDIIRKIKGGR